MTHDDIADYCTKYLKTKGYKLSFSNMTDALASEQPDALGINIYGESILCEVKTSKSDFLADQKKYSRIHPEKGIGDFRVYVTPKGLLTPEEIPYGWMLWEVQGKTKPIMKVIKGKRVYKDVHKDFSWRVMRHEYLNSTEKEYLYFYNLDKNYKKELSWLIKIIRRAEQDGVNMNLYSNNYRRKLNERTNTSTM